MWTVKIWSSNRDLIVSVRKIDIYKRLFVPLSSTQRKRNVPERLYWALYMYMTYVGSVCGYCTDIELSQGLNSVHNKNNEV